ncbi:uncharacterized protein MKK02DRAFT_43102 [Dioszegia hungarica]|uniref:Uncharacterized protein n=1 Tax=Dioszegia hungarica TaxID=4972 RepID=A0AA38HBZ2_9TREE|nr:uncharacterized protein MKK02DRAFT_43102 [Dioszegia hungarica]KAI9638693.1 hypothetical protein MKK02DRAFT_43102 [Dioszegia hungarica]
MSPYPLAGQAGPRWLTLLLSLAVLLPLSLAQSSSANVNVQPFNLTLSSQSPTLFYYPNFTGSGLSSWNVSYSDSSWSTWSPSSLNNGVGSSVHWSNLSDSSVTFSFYGTAAYIYGKVYGGATYLTVDGVTVQTSENGESTTMGMESETSASPTATSAVPGPVASGTPRMDTRPLLAKVEGMGAVWHTVSVKFQGRGGWEIMGVTMTMPVGARGSTIVNSTLISTTDLVLNKDFDFSDSGWAARQTPGNSSDTEAYTSTSNASYSVSVPSNTSLVLIYGSVTPLDARYSVSLLAEDDLALTQGQRYAEYRSLTPWAEPERVLYYASVKPGKNYRVKVELIGNAGGMGMAVDEVVFVSATGNPSANTTWDGLNPVDPSNSGPSNSADVNQLSAGQKGGAIAGGVIGFLLLSALIVWLILHLRRRKARQAGMASDERSQEGSSPEKEVTPFDIDGPIEGGSTTPRPLPVLSKLRTESQAVGAGDGTSVHSPVSYRGGSDASSPVYASSSQHAPTSLTYSRGLPSLAPPLPASYPCSGSSSPITPTATAPDPALQIKHDILAEFGQSHSGREGEEGGAAGMPSPDGRARLEMDAGRVIERDREEVLPPNYDPAWKDS